MGLGSERGRRKRKVREREKWQEVGEGRRRKGGERKEKGEMVEGMERG